MDDLTSLFPGNPKKNAPDDAPDGRDNLTRLLHLGRRKRVRVNRRYSVFVRGMQILLPVVALGIVVIVMAWPKMDDAITAVPQDKIVPEKTGQNELINPRYESADAKGNPYLITAERAVQDLKDSAAVLMEKPVAQFKLGDGGEITGSARHGMYRQQEETLKLEGNIVLKHSNGYTLGTSLLDVAIKEGTAVTDQPVKITGPDATLASAGMRASTVEDIVIFTGPATLHLKKPIKGL